MAMARAPQKITRIMGLITSAPPAFAPTIPSSTRKISDPAATTGSSRTVGAKTRSTNGAAAPTENVAADASAACTGRAVVACEIPSSSRALGAQGILGHELARHFGCQAGLDPASDVDLRQLLAFMHRIGVEFAGLAGLAGEVGVFGVRLGTDGHVFPGGHRHGARRHPGYARDQCLMGGGRGGGDSHHQAGGRDDPVVRTQDRGAEPPYA